MTGWKRSRKKEKRLESTQKRLVRRTRRRFQPKRLLERGRHPVREIAQGHLQSPVGLELQIDGFADVQRFRGARREAGHSQYAAELKMRTAPVAGEAAAVKERIGAAEILGSGCIALIDRKNDRRDGFLGRRIDEEVRGAFEDLRDIVRLSRGRERYGLAVHLERLITA